jgi:hypothetical protein
MTLGDSATSAQQREQWERRRHRGVETSPTRSVMFGRMKMFGPQQVSRVQARETVSDDPHDAIADEPSEQMAHTLEQIAAMISAIERNLECLTQAVLALTRQQGAQLEQTARLLATQKQSEPARPDRSVPAERKRPARARAVTPPKAVGDAEPRSSSAGSADASEAV